MVSTALELRPYRRLQRTTLMQLQAEMHLMRTKRKMWKRSPQGQSSSDTTQGGEYGAARLQDSSKLYMPNISIISENVSTLCSRVPLASSDGIFFGSDTQK